MTTPATVSAPGTGPVDAVVRCSDADRERICERLHAAVADGRLTMEETEERLGAAYAARFHHELDGLVADLPAPAVAATRTGWGLVAGLAREQVVRDVAVLLGRAPGGRAQRIRTLVIAVAMLFLVVSAVVFLLTGVFLGGPGHGHGHEFG